MLPKLDSQFTATVSKTLDTLRSLTDDGRLSQHARINDRPVDEALMQWKWDRGRWGEGGKVAEVIDALTKVGQYWNNIAINVYDLILTSV